MTIGMQGAWTVSWTSKEAGFSQRFRIEGSSNGVDGTYGENESVFVMGDQWGITAEHNPSGPESWKSSRHRLANFRTSGGSFQFEIESDDTGGGPDADFDDLIITCTSTPLTQSEWIVYGTVKTYSGACGVNPCFPISYVVIDTLEQLHRLLAYKEARDVIKKLYPEEVKRYLKRPFPIPDPPPFRPLLIPTGLTDTSGVLIKGNSRYEVSKSVKGSAAETQVMQTAGFQQYAASSDTALLSDNDYRILGKIKDLVLATCDVNPLAETLLRFHEYDRTTSELTGGPYTGEGDRENLGITSTDDFGNYIFRFSRSLSEIVTEANQDIAVGEAATTAALPDIIIQIMESLPEGVAYETAPYYNIPNVRRINLCIPESSFEGVEQPCQEGRAIQYLGNISILPNPHSELHTDGSITNLPSAATGPVIRHGAWRGAIQVYGCFENTSPEVTHYTWEYRHDGESGWNLVNEYYEYDKQQLDSTWDKAKVGPHDTSLRIHAPGDEKVVVPAYLNIEQNDDWAISHRHRKIILRTARYQPEFGAVHFRIQGYDAAGEKVPGADDEFKLLIDNVWSSGDVDYVKLVGESDPGECALLELMATDTPLEVRYRARDMQGFLSSYNLQVWRGSNTSVDINGAPIAGAYNDISPYRYYGTPDESGADLDGYVTVTVTPDSGDWLGGHSFCAFSFELWSYDRLTNGYSIPSGRLLWRELVGLSLPEESTE